MENIILPQIVAVGIYNAQLAVKNRTVTKNRKTTMFEIELPIEDGGITYIDDDFLPISADTVICAKPGQTRHTRLPFKCYYIHLIVSSGALYGTLTEISNFVKLPSTDRIRDIFVKMCELYGDSSPENELMIQSLILELIYTLGKYSHGSGLHGKFKSSNRKVVEDTIEYINSNLTADLSLSALSSRANFTPTYFHKLFKSSAGMPLREYIEEQRIKHAVKLMMSTNLTLTQIAYECGFSSQSYFSYAFKRRMDLPPREYAGQILKKYEV